jgi:hypothetical protein
VEIVVVVVEPNLGDIGRKASSDSGHKHLFLHMALTGIGSTCIITYWMYNG